MELGVALVVEARPNGWIEHKAQMGAAQQRQLQWTECESATSLLHRLLALGDSTNP